jgi:hypothetical protein
MLSKTFPLEEPSVMTALRPNNPEAVRSRPRRDRRARMTGRRGAEHGDLFARMPEQIVESKSYHALPYWAQAVLIALLIGATDSRNGRLELTWPTAKRPGVRAEWQLRAGIKLLDAVDLVRITRMGRLQNGYRLPSWYAVTWLGVPARSEFDVSTFSGLQPRHEWVKWICPADWSAQMRQVIDKARGKGARQRARVRCNPFDILGVSRAAAASVLLRAGAESNLAGKMS